MTPAEEVSTGCRVLAGHGNADLVWGHLSRRDPGGRGVWLKSAGYGMEEITPERVVLTDRAGRLLGGGDRVHLEYPIHTEIMAVRDDVGAVVHSHAESVVAFAATGLPLRPIGHEGTLFWPPDIPRFTATGDLIRDRPLGAAVATALAGRNALLLPRHGLVTAGPDVPAAVLTAIFLEKACRMQLQAAATGASCTWSDESESLAKRARCYGPSQLDDAWTYLLRRLGTP